jgi:predicted MFS family arabinose efflux permease
VMAIAADLFPASMRGRVMGLIQTAFAASQVLGIPAGLYLSSHWDWHMPFFAMAAIGLVGGLAVAWRLRPVDAHLTLPQERGAFSHLLHTATVPRHLLAFATTALLTTGGFMLMPFSSAFTVNNLGIDLHSLPTVYLVTGLCTIVFGPLIGRAADRFGKFRMFTIGTLVSMTMVQVYTHLGPVALPVLIAVNAVLFVGIFSRMIPFQAMVAGVPPPAQRGAFNAIGASVQQLSGGIASVAAGHIVTMGAGGRLQHFDWVGHVVVLASIASFLLLWRLQRNDKRVVAPA